MSVSISNTLSSVMLMKRLLKWEMVIFIITWLRLIAVVGFAVLKGFGDGLACLRRLYEWMGLGIIIVRDKFVAVLVFICDRYDFL